MTDDELMTDGQDLPPGHLEIDALLDGELVDVQALRSALNDNAARDYLVEALMLRELARDMGPARLAIPGAPRGRSLPGMRWLAAGVILAVGLGVGYVYGQRSRTPAASPGLVEVALDQSPAPPAPAATRSIRFEPGVNWTNERRSH